MGRDHFAQYRKAKPDEYKAFSDSVWNTFVSVTHKVGLSHFFSFTPEEITKRKIARDLKPSDAKFPL